MCNHHKNHLFKGNPDLNELEKKIDRRHFLTKTAMGMGGLALASLFSDDGLMTTSQA